MRWADEPWVKVYATDTGDWLALGWEAQSLFLLALRKCDRAGILRTGKNVARGLAGMTGMPIDVVERALPLLLDDGCMRPADGGLVIPNFIAAQEARTSDAQRKREQRARDRDRAIASGMPEASSDMLLETMARSERNVTKRDHGPGIGHTMSSQNVTNRHTASHGVTLRREETRREEKREGLPASQEPQAAQPREELRLEAPKAARQKRIPAEKPPADPRHAPLGLALVAAGWPHHGGRTARALAALLAHADREPGVADAQAEILRRAGIARAWEGFPQAREIHELAANWGHFAAPQRKQGVAQPSPLASGDWVVS